MGPRLDKYKVAQESKFARNRFKVTKLSIIKYWGEKGTIPETVTVNLSKTTAWSLGEEIELDTTEEDEAFVFEQKEKCETEDEEDETAYDSEKDDKDEASNRIKITPSMNESDTESLKRIKIDNNDNAEDTSTAISTISDDISEVRRLRTTNVSDWLTDERAQEAVDKTQAVIDQEPDRYERQERVRRICDTINAAQEGLDLAFAAGTLSTTACIAREDSVRYKERYSKEDAKKIMIDAKAGLKRALEKANYLEKDNFKLLKYWLRDDEDTSANTVRFFERMRKEIK